MTDECAPPSPPDLSKLHVPTGEQLDSMLLSRSSASFMPSRAPSASAWSSSVRAPWSQDASVRAPWSQDASVRAPWSQDTMSTTPRAHPSPSTCRSPPAAGSPAASPAQAEPWTTRSAMYSPGTAFGVRVMDSLVLAGASPPDREPGVRRTSAKVWRVTRQAPPRQQQQQQQQQQD
jgi:hypothetical protein